VNLGALVDTHYRLDWELEEDLRPQLASIVARRSQILSVALLRRDSGTADVSVKSAELHGAFARCPGSGRDSPNSSYRLRVANLTLR